MYFENKMILRQIMHKVSRLDSRMKAYDFEEVGILIQTLQDNLNTLASRVRLNEVSEEEIR